MELLESDLSLDAQKMSDVNLLLNDEVYPRIALLSWLAEKYGIGNPSQITDLSKTEKYGDWFFVLNRKMRPVSLFYRNDKIDLSGQKLRFFYAMMNNCYFDNSSISVEELMTILDIDEYNALNTLQSRVNKILKKYNGIDKTISADNTKDGYRKLNF